MTCLTVEGGLYSHIQLFYFTFYKLTRQVTGSQCWHETRVGGKKTTSSDFTSELIDTSTLLCVLTMCMVTVVITDLDIVDVRVGLQCEDEADYIGSWQQHRNRVHQRPEISSQYKIRWEK